MTDIDPVSRVALVIARAVHRHGRCTRSFIRTRLRPGDRLLFEPALATAAAMVMVRTDGKHHLAPGGRSPDPMAEDHPPHCRTCSC